MPKHNVDMSARIRMAPGARRQLAKHAGSLGMNKPLVVTDPGVAGLDWFQEIEAADRTVHWGVGTHPNIVTASFMALLSAINRSAS